MVYIVVKDLKNNNVVFDIHYPGPHLKNVLETNVLVRPGSITEKNLATVISTISNVNMDNIVRDDTFQHYISPELLNRYFKFSFSESLFFVDPNDVSTEKVTKHYENRFNGFGGFTRGKSIFQYRERYDIKNHYSEPFASKNKPNSNVNNTYDFLEMDQNGVYHLRNNFEMFILRYDIINYKIICNHATKIDGNLDNLSDKFIILPMCDIITKFTLTDYFVKHIKNFFNIDKLEIDSKNIVVSEELIKVLSLFNNELENGLLENNLVSIRHNKTYGEMLNIKNPDTEEKDEKVPKTESKGSNHDDEEIKRGKSLIRKILVKNKVDFSPEPTDTHKDTFTFTFHNGEQYILFWSGYYVKAKPESNPKKIGVAKLKDLNVVFKSLDCLNGYSIYITPQGK